MTEAYLPEELPPPGIDGTYAGSCTLCLRGTDTVVGIEGEAEWVVALMHLMGLPFDQCLLIVSEVTGCEQGMVPPDRFSVQIKLCKECSQKITKFKVKVGPLGGGVPFYTQPYNVADGRHR